MKKIILIGYGYWGKILANQLNKTKGIKFLGIQDNNILALKEFKKKFPEKKIFKSINEILKDKENIDGAVVATNFKSLFTVTSKLLKNNINCLVEKPVSKSGKEILELKKIAKKQKVVCMPGYIFLHNNYIQYIKEVLNKKLLGNIRIITFERTNLGPVREDLNSIWDLASHDISILNFFFGHKIKIENQFSKDFLKKNVSDYAIVNFSIKNSIFGFIHCSWLNPKKERRIVIVGDKKMLVWNDMNEKYPVVIYDKGVKKKKILVENYKQYKNYLFSGEELTPKIKTKTPLENELLHFISAIKKDRNYINMDFALKVSNILNKIK
jgi:predicted dehydrogenase